MKNNIHIIQLIYCLNCFCSGYLLDSDVTAGNSSS